MAHAVAGFNDPFFYAAEERALADDERLSSLELDPVAVGMPTFPVADRVVTARSTLTIEGASTVVIGLHDPDWLIERSGVLDEWADGRLDPVDITFDGITYRLAKAARQSTDTLELTFEDRVVALLRTHTKHLAASRGSMTRAQFIFKMLREVKALDIPFYSPERDRKQPIATAKYPAVATGPGSSGFDQGTTFRVKGAKADSEQIRNASVLMSVCDQFDASPRARLAILVAAIGESSISVVPNQGGSPYGGVLQGKFRSDAQGPKQFDINDTEGMARSFLKGGKGYQAGGAIKLARENPGMSVGTIAYLVEGDISNFSGPAAAENFYQQHHDEAAKIASLWNSGTGHGSSADQVLYAKQFTFTRGLPGKKESTWTAANRLAGDVNWRFFVAAGIAAFVSDDRMMLTPAAVTINDFDDGGLIDRPAYDWDIGKVAAEITQRVSAARWSVRPATVVAYRDTFGKPVAGRWLVHTVEQNLLDATDCTLTLIKPLPPRKEPAPEIVSRSTGTGTSSPGSGGADAAIKWARSKIGHFKESLGQNLGPELNRLESGFNMRGEPWCAIFATTAVSKGGPGEHAKTALVAQIRTWALAGTHGYQRGFRKTPQPGDLLLLGNEHVALVEKVRGDSVGTIEGNTSAEKVVRLERATASGDLVRPDYLA